MELTWEQIVNNMFNSKNSSELDLRAFCTYSILKDRIYTEVLSDVLRVLEREGVDVESDIWITVWSKLTSAAIYMMTHTALQYFKNKEDDADNFNIFVYKIFFKDFNERKETLIEYERVNPNLGKGQVVWAMGAQICTAVGRESAFLVTKLTVFWKQIIKIERETTSYILKASLDELKDKVLKLNYIKMQKGKE